MNRLEESRAVIDRVDRELVKLFEQRFEAILSVAEYKRENNMPVFDPAREQAIIAARSQEVREELRPYFTAWYREMLNQSKDYQKKVLGLEDK